MKNVCLRFSARVAALLVAGLPLAAQSPDAATDILKGFSHPPLHLVFAPDAVPDTVGCVTPTCYSPKQMRAIYGFNKIPNQGQGQMIAIVDAFDDPTAEADLATFNTQFALPACTTANGCFHLVYQSGPGSPPPADTSGWSNEVAIDIQWAHSIAPAAKIMLVEANSNSNADLYAAVDVAVAHRATVVSMSWSGGEASNETSSDTHFNVPGVTFLAASGDGGHGPRYPAASPFVVAVGGTSLTATKAGVWQSETAWSGSGGGASKFEPEPAYQGGVQSSGKRGVPDIGYDGDPNTGVPAYNSHACSACFVGWGQWGGTSIGTPQWAALIAIANSQRRAASKSNLTQPQVVLYPIAEGDYHDITSGTNGSCGAQCTAVAGYDFVTGVGSPLANLVIPALVAAP